MIKSLYWIFLAVIITVLILVVVYGTKTQKSPKRALPPTPPVPPPVPPVKKQCVPACEHGTCTPDGVCECESGYSGKACNQIVSSLSPLSNSVRSYFSVLYPLTAWDDVNDESVLRLWFSLNWYYLPAIGDVGLQTIMNATTNEAQLFSRRAPLQGPYMNQWTEAFLSDSTDQQIWFEPLSSNKPCTGSQKNPFSADDPCFSCKGSACDTCCPPDSICVTDKADPRHGNCQLSLAASFCSVFPSDLPQSMGATYTSNVHACPSRELQGATPSAACMKDMYGGLDVNPVKDAKSYQFLALIQPYAKKQGCPNYGFMEQVAFVCEAMGKSLLTAPQSLRPSSTDSQYVGALSRTQFCGFECNGETDWDNCKKSAETLKRKIQSRLDTGANDGSLKGTSMGPSGCFFSQYNVFDARKPNGQGIWTGNVTSGHANMMDKASTIPVKVTLGSTYKLGGCIAHPNYSGTQQCTGKTMFYWQAGYGKFMNMGKTAIFNNYIHLFLTITNSFPQGEGHPRQTGPETINMGVGSSALVSAQMLMESPTASKKDTRKYLQGFQTCFQTDSPLGIKHGLIPGSVSDATGGAVKVVFDVDATDDDWNDSVIVLSGRLYWAKQWGAWFDPLRRVVRVAQSNDWYNEIDVVGNNGPPGVENANGMMNPQEGIEQWFSENLHQSATPVASAVFSGDANLCHIASQCIHCYYPPNLRVRNPHFNKPVGMGYDDGLTLWQAMYIYGDTGGDPYGYSLKGATCRQLDAKSCSGFPYGSYYFSAAIGSCIYALTAAMGWNSSQFTLMSTGGGNAKFCTYPGYDYEIVSIADRNVSAAGVDEFSFKLLDVSAKGNADVVDFYAKYGFLQGSNSGGLGTVMEANTASNKSARMSINTSVYSCEPFDACKMPLNEANVDPYLFGSKTVNELFYDEASGECDATKGLASYYECVAAGGTPTGFVYGENASKDCPYADAKGAVRTQAIDGKYNGLFINPVAASAQWPLF